MEGLRLGLGVQKEKLAKETVASSESKEVTQRRPVKATVKLSQITSKGPCSLQLGGSY